MARGQIFCAIAAALFGALLLCVAGFGLASPAMAQAAIGRTIENIAQAQWVSGGIVSRTDSNRVTLNVIPNTSQIDIFRPSAGGTTTAISQTMCQGSLLPSIGVPSANGSVASVERAISFLIGDVLVFRVTAARANRDPSSVDMVNAVLTTSSGEREEVEIFETAPDSGVFVGAMQSTAIPPSPVAGDCRLSVAEGEIVSIAYLADNDRPIATATVSVLADPFGIVFDSEDGSPVSGARVSLVDAATGLPATVFADDGVTPWPSSVISGQSVTDGAGNVYDFLPGEYRFPLAPLGTYRLLIEAPTPYTSPSEVSIAQLAGLRRPNGDAFLVSDASYGGSFALASLEPVRVDVPVDRPNVLVSLSKSVSRPSAMPGDTVFYTLELRNADPLRAKRDVVLVDTPSQWLRLRRDTVRIDGESADNQAEFASDGSSLTIRLPEIAVGATRRITYGMTVRPDAPEGDVLNRAEVTDLRGERAITSAALKIEREAVGDRMTLIGRVTEGSCLVEHERRGIPGVRVMLEDGSFALTDADGRYHFEGLLPGTHVVQVQSQTLPQGGQFVDCDQTAASAGSATSRFVRGQGGSLAVADFHAVLPEGWAPPQVDAEPIEVADDAVAAGADTDWLAIGDGPTEFLFPQVGHNPRAPAVRVVLRHDVGQTIELTANGEAVDPLSFDGTRAAPRNRYAISIWRGVALEREVTVLRAVIRNADGSVAHDLTREVFYSAAAARAELLSDASHLVADGASRPVIAVRITDRHGRPVRAGISGSVVINAPYESAAVLDRLQQQQVSGVASSSPAWRVEGDDGIALIELAPTMVSGPLHLEFTFTDGEVSRRQEIDSWVVPGDQEWTLVGLVEGSIGARSVADNMERAENFDSDLGENARVAFYAKGRVLGRFLLTAAYDSARQEDAERLTGAIDPNAYYSVFADGSVRRFDAASREKLYVRIETDTFYAIYGDIQTGFEQTRLARYARAVTGVRAEGQFGAVHVQGFASETETLFRRDELQGGGISGPYSLSSRAIVANSERVAIEVRDRFRSEVIVSRVELQRFTDYDIDLLSGTITFARPVLSRDAQLNPQFIVVDYEVDSLTGTGEWNAGARADVTLADGALRIGASAIIDQSDGVSTDLLAADARVTFGGGTEFRGEIAASRSAGSTATAWLVEAQHHDGSVDLVAYARSVDADFGVGQLNGVEAGRVKIGVDARVELSEEVYALASAWRDNGLSDITRRDALQGQIGWRNRYTDLTLGLARFDDRLADGTSGTSTVLEGGVTQRMLGNRLQITGATSIGLGSTESIDLPTRHRLGARFAVTNDVALLASYEIAEGDAIDARTLRGGVEVSPWHGARATAGYGQQNIAEFGQRSFAAFGLSQSLQVTPSLTLDATIDGNRQLGGVDPDRVINPLHPVASGGQLADGTLFEDFTAVTIGAGWRRDLWSVVARGEYRDGEEANRRGFTFGAVRQLGEGSVVGSGFSWTRANGAGGSTSEIFDGAISAAYRPANSEIALLGKLEYRSDAVSGAVAGELGPAGRTALTVTGDAQSRRLLASISTNWSPRRYRDGEGLSRLGEFGLFLGGRYTFEGFENIDVEGFTALVGADGRLALANWLELGGRATVRSNLTDGVSSYAFGPEIGLLPTTDVLLTLGYNVSGFSDRDYSAARNTDAGLYASMRLKLDADSFSFLGLSR